MLLAIDSGNTNIVFAVFDGDELRGEWRSSNDSRKTADEYGIWLTQLMSLGGFTAADISDAIIATVVPETLFNLKTLCRKYFDTEPMVIGGASVDICSRTIMFSRAPEIRTRLMTIYIVIMFLGGGLSSWLGAATYEFAGWTGISIMAVTYALTIMGLSLWGLRFRQAEP